MSNICVIGAGYAGLVAAAGFAELGHGVVCLDVDENKIEQLQDRIVPFHEPGLEAIMRKDGNWLRMSFTTDYAQAVPGQDFVYIVVNTPPMPDGRPSLDQITGVTRTLTRYIDPGTIVVNKSTGPVGMAVLIRSILAEYGPEGKNPVVSNPEFLREGHGMHDFLHPFEVVIGAWEEDAGKAVGRLYEPLSRPIIYCEPPTAEMTKLVSNAFRAVKVSFINEIAAICEKHQVDVTQVSEFLGADKAIGPAFLNAGVGWGGNCLPKDVLTLRYVAESCGVEPQMLEAAFQVNEDQRTAIVEKLRSMLGSLEGRTVGILGLAFKGGTDDVRRAPAIGIIRQLQEQGCDIKAYDPLAMQSARSEVSGVSFCTDAYDVALGSDAVALLTDWPEFRELELERLRALMAQPYFIDGRNVLDPAQMAKAGFLYAGVGRGYQAATGNGSGTAPVEAYAREAVPNAGD